MEGCCQRSKEERFACKFLLWLLTGDEKIHPQKNLQPQDHRHPDGEFQMLRLVPEQEYGQQGSQAAPHRRQKKQPDFRHPPGSPPGTEFVIAVSGKRNEIDQQKPPSERGKMDWHEFLLWGSS